MLKSASLFGKQGLLVASLGLFLILQPGRAATTPVTVTITQRSPIEALSPSGEVTGVTEATVGTHYTLVSSNGPQVILQDTQGAHYCLALSATDYKPPAPVAPATLPPATNSTPPAHKPAALTKTPAPAAPSTDIAPVISDSKTIQFPGACPIASQHSQYIRYDFELNQEHFWLYVPPAYDGNESWGLVVYISPAATTEDVPEGWGEVLSEEKLLFICPQQAGNDQPNSRREGLAVIAALEMMKLYAIDPNRIYAAGYSGGAREACNLGFHQPDIFHATIQSCGANFHKPVPRTSVTPAELQANPEKYGLLEADAAEIEKARKQVKFVLITGSKDFRQHYIQDIYNGGFKAEGFNAKLLDIDGMRHEPCHARELREALDYIQSSP